jgi:hypothetical protein
MLTRRPDALAWDAEDVQNLGPPRPVPGQGGSAQNFFNPLYLIVKIFFFGTGRNWHAPC